MTTYRIHSSAGIDFGTHDAPTPDAALLLVHRDAGYGADVVTLEDGDLVFSGDNEALLGGVDAWDIEIEG